MRRLFAAATTLALLVVLGLATSARAEGEPGNSGAAHECQWEGYLGLIGSGGVTFSSTGECVSFAARGGTFLEGIVIPAGSTATLSNAVIGACNDLTYGYQINSGPVVPVDNKPYGCHEIGAAGTTVGPFPTAVLLRIVLVDNTCDDTFYSDGNHATVTGSDPYHVAITDSGGNCEYPEGVSRIPNEVDDGNLNVTVDLS